MMVFASLTLWLAVLIATVSPATAHAATPQCPVPGPWTRIAVAATRAGGPLSPWRIAADPSVIRDGALYRMWFTNANSLQQTGIAMATSTDGTSWDVFRSAIAPDVMMDLVAKPAGNAWDTPGLETASVLRAPDGSYRLYYTGDRAPQGSSTYAIGMATSPDGITWTQREQPVLEASNAWEQPLCTTNKAPNTCSMGGVLEPSVLYDASARLYKMWYVGLGEAPNSFRTFRIGYATSVDGIVWQRHATPVLTPGGPGAWDEMWTSQVNVVADPGAGYHMFYGGTALKDYRNGVEMQRGAIGHAFSLDGITWQKDAANPVIAPRPLQVDGWAAGGPSALIEGSTIKLWYSANPSSGLVSSVVLATARCGP